VRKLPLHVMAGCTALNATPAAVYAQLVAAIRGSHLLHRPALVLLANSHMQTKVTCKTCSHIQLRPPVSLTFMFSYIRSAIQSPALNT
jgi:hypothetical protein